MYSLQARLGLWLGLMLVLIFGMHILLMSHFPRYLAEERVLARLQHDAESLYNRLIIHPDQAPALGAVPDSSIYRESYSGHYFQLWIGDRRLYSPSLNKQSLNISSTTSTEGVVAHADGPKDEHLLVWLQKMTKNNQSFVIAMAEDISDIEEDIATRQRFYFIGTSLSVFLLLILQRFIIRYLIKPVEQARQDLLAVEQGKLSRIYQKVPTEIQPLVDELNHLLEVMSKRLERSRNATGNLAHSLKTPLSVLNQLLNTPEIKANTELHDEILQISSSIQTSIDRELKWARLAGGRVPGQRFAVEKEIQALAQVMEKIYEQKKLQFEIIIPVGKYCQADREDMLEMFGNLLDNACKWAKRRVKLTVLDKQGLAFIIEDDGIGVDENLRDTLAERGTRLDEKTQGHGLGLSIVKEIVNQYGGDIFFTTSEELGGLRVKVLLVEKGEERKHDASSQR